jgi:hypothetical protein
MSTVEEGRRKVGGLSLRWRSSATMVIAPRRSVVDVAVMLARVVMNAVKMSIP